MSEDPKSGLKLYNDVVAVAAVVHIFDCDLTSDWLSSSGILYLNIPLPPFMSLVLGSDGFLILTVLPTSMKWFSLFVILAATFGCGDSGTTHHLMVESQEIALFR